MKIRMCNTADGKMWVIYLDNEGFLVSYDSSDKRYWQQLNIASGIKDFCAIGIKNDVKVWAIGGDDRLSFITFGASGMRHVNPEDNCLKELCARVEVARRPGNRCEVFMLTKNGALYGKIQLEEPSRKHHDGVWSGWTWIDTHGEVYRDLHVSYNADEHIELFFLTSDNKIRNYFDTNSPSGWQWGDFSKFGHEFEKIHTAYSDDKRQELFCVGKDKKLYHIWQTTPSGGWSNSWAVHSDDVQDITAVTCINGCYEIFAMCTDGRIKRQWQSTKNGGCGEWQYVESPECCCMESGRDSKNNSYLIVLTKDQILMNMCETYPNSRHEIWDTFNHAYWMSEIYEYIKDKPLGRISYPGSHDAGTYEIPFWEEVPSSMSDEGKYLFTEYLVRLVRQVQQSRIGVQLRSGCRYFDLRVVRAKNGHFYCEHEYVSGNMADILQDLKNYLEEGKAHKKKELIILDISKFADNAGGGDVWKEYRIMLEKYIGEFIFRKEVENLQEVAYKDLFESDKPCVVIFELFYMTIGKMGNRKGCVWPKTSDIPAIIASEKSAYNSYKSGGKRKPGDYYMLHFTRTFMVSDLKPDILGMFKRGDTSVIRSQLELSLELNTHLHELEGMLVESAKSDFTINVLYMDSPDCSDVTKYAYGMNLMAK